MLLCMWIPVITFRVFTRAKLLPPKALHRTLGLLDVVGLEVFQHHLVPIQLLLKSHHACNDDWQEGNCEDLLLKMRVLLTHVQGFNREHRVVIDDCVGEFKRDCHLRVCHEGQQMLPTPCRSLEVRRILSL